MSAILCTQLFVCIFKTLVWNCYVTVSAWLQLNNPSRDLGEEHPSIWECSGEESSSAGPHLRAGHVSLVCNLCLIASSFRGRGVRAGTTFTNTVPRVSFQRRWSIFRASGTNYSYEKLDPDMKTFLIAALSSSVKHFLNMNKSLSDKKGTMKSCNQNYCKIWNSIYWHAKAGHAKH